MSEDENRHDTAIAHLITDEMIRLRDEGDTSTRKEISLLVNQIIQNYFTENFIEHNMLDILLDKESVEYLSTAHPEFLKDIKRIARTDNLIREFAIEYNNKLSVEQKTFLSTIRLQLRDDVMNCD